MKLDIVGVSEVRWTGVGQVEDENWKLFYSGGENHRSGVGVLVRREVAAAVSTWWPVNDRIIYLNPAKPSLSICNVLIFIDET